MTVAADDLWRLLLSDMPDTVYDYRAVMRSLLALEPNIRAGVAAEILSWQMIEQAIGIANNLPMGTHKYYQDYIRSIHAALQSLTAPP